LVFFCFWLLPFSKKEKEKHSHLHLLLHLAIHLQRVSDPLRTAVLGQSPFFLQSKKKTLCGAERCRNREV
jgi:hypothetical protein